MAKAVINLQKESGGIVKISPVDGTGVTEVTVPESGNLVSVGTAVTDNAIARYDGTTGKLQNSGVIIDDSDRLLVGNTPSGLNTLGQLIVNQPSSGNVNLGLTNKTNDSYSYIYNDGTALKISNTYHLTAGYKPIILQTGDSDRLTLGANGNLLVGTTTDNGIDKLQVNGSSNIYGLNTALQYKRTSNYASGMSGYFGDKIEYAMRTVTSSITKTFRVTNSTPSNNENFGLFFKARWAIYNQTPCVGSYEYCVGFKQPGSGATCVFVNATSGNAIGATSPLSVSSTAINSTSFDVTITVNSYYTNVVLELEAIFTSGTCTITPL